jgi:ABC-type Fe3+/spermidine/putrescine transport system ATPase subunit
VYERPHTRFVATFIGDTNLLEGDRDGADLLMDGLRIAVPAAGTIATIRPERVLMGAQVPSDAANAFTGLVEQVTFQGSVTKYRLRLPTGQPLLVERPSTNVGSSGIATGASVPCALPVDAIVMVQPS